MTNDESPSEIGASNGADGTDIERTPRGQFAPGNRGGPGCPPAARRARQLRARLDEAMRATCSDERLRKAIDAVLAKAERGDVAALRTILERICPAPSADASSDFDELVIRMRPIPPQPPAPTPPPEPPAAPAEETLPCP